MASVVIFDNLAVANWLKTEPGIRIALETVGAEVAAQAQATASSAEEGAGGRITGYASSGFRVEWKTDKRPQVRVYSNADAETFTAAHFHTQIRDGVAHLRAALYAFTRRG